MPLMTAINRLTAVTSSTASSSPTCLSLPVYNLSAPLPPKVAKQQKLHHFDINQPPHMDWVADRHNFFWAAFISPFVFTTSSLGLLSNPPLLKLRFWFRRKGDVWRGKGFFGGCGWVARFLSIRVRLFLFIKSRLITLGAFVVLKSIYIHFKYI